MRLPSSASLPGTTMLTSVRGTNRPTRRTVSRVVAAQSAMHGQSLPQSGPGEVSGQHGMSAGAAAASASVIAAGSPVDAFISDGVAITGRPIGLSTRPAIARTARRRRMAERLFTVSLYHGDPLGGTTLRETKVNWASRVRVRALTVISPFIPIQVASTDPTLARRHAATMITDESLDYSCSPASAVMKSVVFVGPKSSATKSYGRFMPRAQRTTVSTSFR